MIQRACDPGLERTYFFPYEKTAIAIYIAKLVTGLRVSEEVEREGLDLGEHGERAYNY